MSGSDNTVAQVLIASAVKVVGKREFLKTVETMFGFSFSRKEKQSNIVHGKEKKARKPRTLKAVADENRCFGRVKGEVSAVVGKRHFFESAQCTRSHVDSSDLCAIHRNQVEKFGSLPDGRMGETITEEQKERYAASHA